MIGIFFENSSDKVEVSQWLLISVPHRLACYGVINSNYFFSNSSLTCYISIHYTCMPPPPLSFGSQHFERGPFHNILNSVLRSFIFALA